MSSEGLWVWDDGFAAWSWCANERVWGGGERLAARHLWRTRPGKPVDMGVFDGPGSAKSFVRRAAYGTWLGPFVLLGLRRGFEFARS